MSTSDGVGTLHFRRAFVPAHIKGMNSCGRSRRPSGSPAGGQFSPEDRDEVVIELSGEAPSASEWADYGFVDSTVIEAWGGAGFDAAGARRWSDLGYDPESADDLRSEAAARSDIGYDIEAAKRGDARRAALSDGPVSSDDEQAAGLTGAMLILANERWRRDQDRQHQILQAMVNQIGGGNIAAISGGRVGRAGATAVNLPVSNGYVVRVEYVPGRDTYRVERLRTHRGVARSHGSVEDVYADQLGEVAYRASCFHDGPFGDGG